MNDPTGQDFQPQHIRVFLSSPGDVADERAIARQLVENLAFDPLLRGVVRLEAVAWDDPHSRTPMLATLSPQEAIDRGLPKPAECDIVVVILWARIGTPLDFQKYTKPDGTTYVSGTEWEYENAIESARKTGSPLVLVFRRTEIPEIKLNDSERKQKIEQYERVETFFSAFRNPDGTWKQGYNEYASPDIFRQDLERFLKILIKQLLEQPTPSSNPQPQQAQQSESAFWNGSPFPGLRSFTPEDSPIFFGRGRETDELIKRLSDPQCRFLAVVGASGSGKSSLVGAGVIPRLQNNAILGSKDWLLPYFEKTVKQWVGLRFTPGEFGDNPFIALATKLVPLMVGNELTALQVAERISTDPSCIETYLEQTLQNQQFWSEVLLLIDQLEELFTLSRTDLRQPFIEMMFRIARHPKARILATIRDDFYRSAIAYPKLAELLQSGSYPLSAPRIGALHDMITRPAASAGLEFEAGLPQEILTDTGDDPGALALMAYALDELYQASSSEGKLTFAVYQALGGVKGAIAKRAENTLQKLPSEPQATARQVFRSLVALNEGGVFVRQRVSLNRLTVEASAKQLVDAMVQARLVVSSSGSDQQPIVEVAHEALITNWPRLQEWLTEDREFLRWRRQLQSDVWDWQQHHRDRSYLYRGRRFLEGDDWAKSYLKDLNQSEQEFITESRKRHRMFTLFRGAVVAMLAIISIVTVGNFILREIVRLDAREEMETFNPGPPIFDSSTQSVISPAFQIEKYEVSIARYRSCVEAGVCSRPAATTDSGDVLTQDGGFPITMVNAYQAHTFCTWIGRRLPTSAEWEWAARGGNNVRQFPWAGNAPPSSLRVNMQLDMDFDENGNELGEDFRPERSVEVDAAMNSEIWDGRTPEGLMHVLGNVSEWTATLADCDDSISMCIASWDDAPPAELIVRNWGWKSGQLRAPVGGVSGNWDIALTVVADDYASEEREDRGFRCAADG